jgi:hypothetical protein
MCVTDASLSWRVRAASVLPARPPCAGDDCRGAPAWQQHAAAMAAPRRPASLRCPSTLKNLESEHTFQGLLPLGLSSLFGLLPGLKALSEGTHRLYDTTSLCPQPAALLLDPIT